MTYKKEDFSCCYNTCPKTAEFVIIDEADADPYTRETHSCARCLGAMIGHSTAGTISGADRWTVYPLEDIYTIVD